MTVVRVCAMATFVVSFNFLAAFFALKRWHRSSQDNIAEKHNNFSVGSYVLKQSTGLRLEESTTISQEAKGYSISLLILGNLGIAL